MLFLDTKAWLRPEDDGGKRRDTGKDKERDRQTETKRDKTTE